MKSKSSRMLGSAWLLMFALAAAGAGCQKEPERGPVSRVEEAPATTAQVTTTGLRRVLDAKKVCMVNNTVFDRDQIPILVGDKTYYGCCEMCKERLAKDPEVRYAADPVSGARVDKASAVIAALPDGTTLYFENETNFQEYSAKAPG